ncbi:MAG: threonine synthase [Bacillota bacterium]|nr:threonine synthase [Negativicutes bacterium]
MRWPGIVEAFRDYLPVSDKTPVVTLNEGNTPLLTAPYIASLLGKDVSVYVKYEGLNPTGSFKDRGMAMAVTKAKEEGSKAIICASTGNTSAAAAAYAARCGMRCIVLIPEGNIALGKLAQAMLYGATVVAINGNFDKALELVKEISQRHPITLVNSVNPYRIEGQKTGSFEICSQLGHAPRYHAIPVGNAGNITAYWKGYKEYKANGKIDSLPQMLGFQAAGAAPIVLDRIVEQPDTVATAIRIGNPASWQYAKEAISQSGGLIEAVTDEQILEAYQLLARHEGIFVEPASAASVAGILQLAKRGFFKPGDDVVCILTGHGLKDPDNALKLGNQPVSIPADIAAVEKIILG